MSCKQKTGGNSHLFILINQDSTMLAYEIDDLRWNNF